MVTGENAQGQRRVLGFPARAVGLGCLALFLIVSLFSCVIGASVFNNWQDTYNTGTKLQNELNSRYVDNQNVLSTYLSQLHQKLGVAAANTNDLDRVLSDAMKGGYTQVCDKSACGLNQGAPFYGAVLKAYPSLGDVTSLYKDIFKTIGDGETAFGQVQTILVDRLGKFDTWRQSFPQNFYAGVPFVNLTFPNANLISRINGDKKTGMDAEDQMWKIVTSSGTQKDFQSGTRQDLETPIATPGK